jgi:cytochrome bd-type quinol oxidase subunit 1
MIDDAVFLARLQFAFTMTFHIIFPTFTVGLVAWIATLEGMWLATGRERYYLLARFWTIRGLLCDGRRVGLSDILPTWH